MVVATGVETMGKGETTRNAIIRATFRVVAERGAHRLSLPDIAAEAGVSKGLIHYHFASKADVLAKSLEWAIRATAEQIRSTLAMDAYQGDPLSGLVAAIFVDPAASRHFYLAYLDLVEHISRDTTFDAFGEMTAEVIEGVYLDIVREGIAAGRFGCDDLEVAAADIRIIVDGIFVRWLQEADWESAHPVYAGRCRRLLGIVLRERQQ